MTPIYLDYAATTPVDPAVVHAMLPYLTQKFGNAASTHVYGKEALAAIEIAREQVASRIAAEPSEIIWTSGATEANNLALKGAARLYQRRGKHIITMQTEHKSVLDTCHYLEKSGFDVTYLPPKANGLLDFNTFLAALRPDTILVSIMHVNNETGVIQDLAAIAQETAARQILLHVDAAQSIGKVALSVRTLPIDLVSLCAHKVYGPKGIGALYIRKKPRVRVEPLLHGGGHEQGMRSGTLPTHQCVGMGAAFALAELTDHDRIQALSERFLPCHPRAGGDPSVPHILNMQFTGIAADTLLSQLPNIAASIASACEAARGTTSHVLRAMGLSEEAIRSAVRFSFGRFTTAAEVETVAHAISRIVRRE